MKKLIVLRGVPGSGKSHEATRIRNEAISDGKTSKIHSTDSYFLVTESGSDPKYVFDQNKIGDYHRQNQQAARQSMKSGVDVVIIDNTNTRFREFYDYVFSAVDQGYEVEFVEPSSPWWCSVKPLLHGHRSEKKLTEHAKTFTKRNAHGVPENAIMRMLVRWECDPTVENVLNAN